MNPALAEALSPARARGGVALAAVALYVASLGFGFTLDDPAVALENPAVRCGRLLELWSTPYHHGPRQEAETGLYRPVTTLSFAGNHLLHGPRASGFHALNVLLHAGVSVLVLDLALALGLAVPGALLAALLFAVHPVHVEAVASISGRADLLAAGFFLLALLAWIRLRRDDGEPAPMGLAAASFLSLFAMLSKEHAVVFPAVAAAWEILRSEGARPRRRPATRALVSIALLLIPLAAYLGLRAAALGRLLPGAGSVTPIENPIANLGFLERLPTVAAVLGRYAKLLVFPWTLSPDYSFAEILPVRSFLDVHLLLGLLAVGLVGLLLARSWRRGGSVPFAIVLGAAALFPVANLAFPIGTILAERLLYLPSAGLCLALGSLGPRIAGSNSFPAARSAVALILLLASARTFAGTLAWREDFALASHAAAASPRSVKALGNLAIELAIRGRMGESRELLDRAISLAPEFWPNRINLAGVLLSAGDLDGAENEIRRVLDERPGNASALLQRSLLLEKRGDLAGAEASARQALASAPKLDEPRARLAALLRSSGRIEEAREIFQADERTDCGD